MSYVGAPYNFVPFAAKTYTPNTRENLEIHDRIDDELLTGEISYKMEAKTPIFVDSGKGEFFKNEAGEYVIPGSSMRGLIRGNVQILSASDFDRDIEDYSLMYRHVAFGALKKHYNDVLGNRSVPYGKGNISVLANVKAGYICCEKGKYYIYPTKLEHVDNNTNLPNYYVLSERAVVDQYLDNRNAFPFSFFIRDGKSIMQHTFAERFEQFTGKDGRKHYKGDTNRAYQPFFEKCSYNFRGKNITAVDYSGKLGNEGMVISTGEMREKKAIYIIPEMDADPSGKIEISQKDVKAFNIDFNQKVNTLKPKFGKKNKANAVKEAEAFYGLPQNEQDPKPVFYIKLDGKLYFGFTPRLRLFYEHSIKEGYSKGAVDAVGFDMATSLFGLSDNDKGSFKSKVSFTDVKLVSGSKGDADKVVLAGPKPSSYLDYVIQPGNQNNKPKTYNDSDFALRGVKQYWLRNEIYHGNQNSNNANIGSAIKPMAAGSIFSGKIRFDNLSRQELGLLLWALSLEEGSQLNIGKGKPYGYGRVQISDVGLKIRDNKKAYDLSELVLNPYVDNASEVFIEEYKNTTINGKKVTELPSVKAFISMKASEKMPAPEVIRYMSIDDHEYQGRVKALDTIDEVLDLKPGTQSAPAAYDRRPKPNNNQGNSKERVVKVTSVNPDRNGGGRYVGKFDGGMIFEIPSDIARGDEVKIKITKERDDGFIYSNFIEKVKR